MTISKSVHCAAAICCAIVLGAVVAGGCDTVGSDTITLQKDVDFRFEFSTEGHAAAESIHVDAAQTVDFSDLLVAEGFSKDDIITVSVRSVHLERITPPGTSLDAFERAAFSLTAASLTVPTIAESDALPSAREVDLNVVNGTITQVVVQPSFRGRLTVVPRTAEAEQYVLAATMDVVVEAEGI